MTPETIDDDVKKLLKIIGAGHEPIYLDVLPESYAEVVECFPAVQKKILRDGGCQQLGWQIWKTKNIVEAEFHAVWKSPNGELRDITPKHLDIPKILFLPDPNAKYIGAQVDNIRLNITNNRLVDDFIEVCKAIFKILNKGNRKFEYRLILNTRDQELHEFMQQMKSDLSLMIKDNLSRNSPCFCKSGNKYKHCHGNKLNKALSRI